MEFVNGAPVVSVGTTHPWNIAGVGLDAQVAAEYGIANASVIAAVSAQDAHGVRALLAVPSDVVTAQLRSLPHNASAYRIGALVTAENVRAVAAFLRERANTAPVVVDPVVRATLGGALQTDPALPQALLDEIIGAGAIVTPNVDEAALLTGLRVHDEASMVAAGEQLVKGGATAALVTGGHLQGDPVDVLVTARGVQKMSGPRLPGSMRGSGCTLAAALACELARGAGIVSAAQRAHAYVREKIAAARMRGGLQVAF